VSCKSRHFFLEVLDPVSVKLDETELLQALKGDIPRLRQELGQILKTYGSLIEPKAVYTFSRISNIENDQIYLENDVVLSGIILADMLELGQEVVPYVVTVGSRLENEVSRERSLLREWIIEKTADYALEKASAQVRSRVAERLGGIISTFSPGSGTGRLFGINQQESLFRLLDPTQRIGVLLTSSYLMMPRNSVSGILAATGEEYVACEYCPRACENRRKPFRGEYQRLSRKPS
jgi:hypothetical protein